MSIAYTSGDSLPFTLAVTDVNGNAANATSVVLNVTKPDGTVDGPFTVSPTGVGNYVYKYATALSGRFLGNWTVTGGYASATPASFYVAPAQPPVTIDEFAAHLKVVSRDDYSELNITLAMAVGLVESLAGPIVPQVITETHDGGDETIYLREKPVISVATVTEMIALVMFTLTEQPVGQSTSNYGFSVDSKRHGKIVRRAAGSIPVPFSNSLGMNAIGTISVTYTAGRQVPSEKIRYAVKEAGKYFWKSRTATTSEFANANFSATPAAFAGVSDAMMRRLALILGPEELKGPVIS